MVFLLRTTFKHLTPNNYTFSTHRVACVLIGSTKHKIEDPSGKWKRSKRVVLIFSLVISMIQCPYDVSHSTTPTQIYLSQSPTYAYTNLSLTKSNLTSAP